MFLTLEVFFSDCVYRRSQSRKMTLSKDKFDVVKNPYSIKVYHVTMITQFIHLIENALESESESSSEESESSSDTSSEENSSDGTEEEQNGDISAPN